MEVSPLWRETMLPRLSLYPLDYRAAFACSILPYPQTLGLALRLAFQLRRISVGRTTGLPRFVRMPEWVRSRLSAGGAASASDELGASDLDHLPFGPSVSASLACSQ